MPTHPKHKEISRHLLNEITAGKYAKGARLPSEAQLVQQFGVSRPTVGRAMRQLETDGVIERRAGSGTYVKSGSSNQPFPRVLGLLIPGLATTEIFQII